MKNKKLWITVVALALIIVSLFFYGKVQSAFPKYLRVTTDNKLVELSVSHLFSGSKKIEAITDSVYSGENYKNCIDQKDGTVKCASYCPGSGPEYCPPKDGYIGAYNEEGKSYKDIVVTNHSYFFDYAMRRIFGFGQYKESGVLTSNTAKYSVPRVITFLHPSNVKKSDDVTWCNGAIRIERALLGYVKWTNDNGTISVDSSRPAVYFYISRYIYPIKVTDTNQKCINFGLPMDIVEPNIEAVKKYLPKDYDQSKTPYYFLDLNEYPN